jgi:hypothetical protein
MKAQARETMQATLRKVLIDSQVATIAIAVLIAGAIEFVFLALLDPASRVLSFLTVALATNSPPYIPRTMDYPAHNVSLQVPLFDLSFAVNNLACALGPLAMDLRHRSDAHFRELPGQT